MVPRSVALRVLPVYVVGRKGKDLVNAFLDDGSDTSFTREDVTDVIVCKANEEQMSLSALVESAEIQSSTVDTGIESLDGKFHRNLRVKALPQICPAMAVIDWNRHLQGWSHLQDV